MNRLMVISIASVWFTAVSAMGHCEEPAAAQQKEPPDGQSGANRKKAVSVNEARRQAELLHEAMHATLHIVHHQYFREDEGLPIPAAIMKDVFSGVKDSQQVGLRWLVVEGQAMNTDHLAQDDFERKAVEAIKARKPFLERVDDGVYRRAAAITLTSECLKCHVPDRKNLEHRAAGLIISIPLTKP